MFNAGLSGIAFHSIVIRGMNEAPLEPDRTNTSTVEMVL